MQTRDQRLALAVYERVLALDNEYPREQHKARNQYGSMAHKLPILIRTAGLAQALAFVEARHPHKKDKSIPPQLRLLRDLERVLRQHDMLANDDLPATARKVELAEYMRLTQHTLAALLWFKRYAQSVLGVQQGEVDDEEGKDANAK